MKVQLFCLFTDLICLINNHEINTEQNYCTQQDSRYCLSASPITQHPNAQLFFTKRKLAAAANRFVMPHYLQEKQLERIKMCSEAFSAHKHFSHIWLLNHSDLYIPFTTNLKIGTIHQAVG